MTHQFIKPAINDMNLIKSFQLGRFLWTVFVSWYFINFSRNFFNSLTPTKSQIPIIFFIILVLWMAIEYYFGSPFFQSGLVEIGSKRRSVFSLFFYSITIYSIADYSSLNWTQLNILYPYINILGLILFISGVLLRFWTLLILIRTPVQKLMSKKSFQICRHPRYLATLIQTISIPLVFSTYMGFILAVVVGALIINNEIKIEEIFLSKVYKTEYEEYKKKIPRLIPKFFNIVKR
ncbi:MAG: methyltransferase [candidate division WOR-3 bacterium]